MIVSFDPAHEAVAIRTGDHTVWYSAHKPGKGAMREGDQWHHIDVHRRFEVAVQPGSRVECLPLTVKVTVAT